MAAAPYASLQRLLDHDGGQVGHNLALDRA